MLPEDLVHVAGGFSELVFGQLPTPVCEQIERELGLGDIFAMPCALEEDLLGTVAILTHKGGALTNKKRIESVVAHLALALKRRRVEESLRESEQQFRVLIEHLSAGVALVDQAGKFSLYNRQFLQMFGLSADSDIMNVNDQDWSAWQVYNECGQLLDVDEHPVRRAGLTGRAVRDELVEVRLPSGGDGVWMLVSAAPLFGEHGHVEHIICTYNDITLRKRAEKELREADRRKSEFLAVLSHELRNPLAPIRNSFTILGQPSISKEQERRALAVIDRQTSHLTRLVDDLLDVTRISQGKTRLRKEAVELGALVARTAEDYRASFSAQGVDFLIHLEAEPIRVHADRTRITQILGNLLGNALKFTPRGGQVELILERNGPSASVRVRDTGAGISAEVLNRLFQPFIQAEQTLDRSRGGLGLGLASVKGLVELHGGSVRAASDGPGRGAEFTVRLPIDEATEPIAPSGPQCKAAKQRILIIEDHAEAADSLKEILEMTGHVLATRQQDSVFERGCVGLPTPSPSLPRAIPGARGDSLPGRGGIPRGKCHIGEPCENLARAVLRPGT